MGARTFGDRVVLHVCCSLVLSTLLSCFIFLPRRKVAVKLAFCGGGDGMNRARGSLEELAQSGWEDACGGEEILLHIRHERGYKVKYYAEKMQPLFVFCLCIHDSINGLAGILQLNYKRPGPYQHGAVFCYW